MTQVLKGDKNVNYKNVKNKLFGLLSSGVITREFLDCYDAAVSSSQNQYQNYNEPIEINNRVANNASQTQASEGLMQDKKTECIKKLKELCDEYPSDSTLPLIIDRLNNINDSIFTQNTSMLASLKEKGIISNQLYNDIRDVLVKHKNAGLPQTPRITNHHRRNNDALQGATIGVIMAFFLSLIGLVICQFMGDDECNKAARITFVIQLALAIIVLLIVYVILPMFVVKGL